MRDTCWPACETVHSELSCISARQVNLAMAATGITQLTRKVRHDYGQDAASEAQQAAEGLQISKDA